MNKTEHLLTIIAEEATEVAQAATKALRFGLKDVNPNTRETNLFALRKECSELIAVCQMLYADMGDSFTVDGSIGADKIDRVNYWLEYSKKQGKLT
jgi:hypothetical protein